MPLLDFDLRCHKCNAALISGWKTIGSLPTLIVEPCKTCLEQSRASGIQQAKEEESDE